MKRLKAEVGFYVFQAFPDGFRHGFLFLRRVVGAGVQDFSRGIRHMDGGYKGLGEMKAEELEETTMVPLASDIRTEDVLCPPPDTLPMGGMGIW